MKRYIHLVATQPDFPFGKKFLYFCLSNCEELLVGLFSRELMGVSMKLEN